MDDIGRVPDGIGLSQAEPFSRLGPSGFDPSRRLLYNRWTDDEARSSDWITDEQPPRFLSVQGTARIDPDVFVARDGAGAAYWIVKSTGTVCGLGSVINPVTARPASGMSAGTAETQSGSGQSPPARPEGDAQNPSSRIKL